MTYAQIAQIMEMSIQGVRLALLRGMDKIHDPDITKRVQITLLEKYDLLAERNLQLALGGDEKAELRFMKVAQAMAEVGGCLQVKEQGGAAAGVFNYYMPTVETDPLAHVDRTDFDLPRSEIKLPPAALMRSAGEITPTPQT